MSQSLSQLYVHIIFHIKFNSPRIKKTTKNDLFSYIASIIKDNESIPIIINGVEDHVHILCIQSKNIALAKLVEEIKRHSSRWIKKQDSAYKSFAWQGGYAGFSVSPSVYDRTKKYIENQEEHHRKRNFQEEYLLFLKEYGIDYDERYLWTD
ncbi:MAG: transposase [Salinivirgaceae bacterium]|nr:MAG: transposase [Salinivirgaceae bacterium]